LQEILSLFSAESNWRNTVPKHPSIPGASSSALVQTELQEDAWHASGAQVSATPVMQLELQAASALRANGRFKSHSNFSTSYYPLQPFLRGDMYK